MSIESVRRVRRVRNAALTVRRSVPANARRDGIVEKDLSGGFRRRIAGGVERAHLYVDVHSPARVPPSVDRCELLPTAPVRLPKTPNEILPAFPQRPPPS